MPFPSHWFASSSKAAQKMTPPRFRPVLQTLDDRITPTLAFTSQQSFAVETYPSQSVVADFNGDGRPDVVTMCFESRASTVSVLLNTTQVGASTSTFATQQVIDVGLEPTTVAVGDFNGDGRSDIVIATEGVINAVSVLLNTTPTGAFTLSFATPQTFAVGANPRSVLVGDFNGDGRSDLVVESYGDANVSVLLNTTLAGASTPTFTSQHGLNFGYYPIRLAMGDFNGDGRPDVAATDFQNGGYISVVLNTTPAGASTATFSTPHSFATLQYDNPDKGPFDGDVYPASVQTGDFNGDGRPDLVAANMDIRVGAGYAGSVSVLLNTTPVGATTPTFTKQQTFTVRDYSTIVEVGDFDGDGRSDIMCTGLGTAVTVLLNATPTGAFTPAFATQKNFYANNGSGYGTVGDFNSDGRLDIVTTNNFVHGSVTVLLNTTTDSFATTSPSLVGQFGSAGVWTYNRNAGQWVNLTQANANALATAPNGNIVASFDGNGVWYYRPLTGWVQINGYSASALAIDASGNAYINFGPAYGTYQYNLTVNDFIQLSGTTAGADKLVVSSRGDVIANFNGYGLYEFRWTTGWTLLTNVDATALAAGPNGDVAASFAGFGTYLYKMAEGWKQINGATASSLAVGADGAVAAVFAGYGVAKYFPYAQGWATLTDNAAGLSVAMDLYGNIFASFNGGGVWEFNAASGWYQRHTAEANYLSLGH